MNKLILTALIVILVSSCNSAKKTLRHQNKCAKWGACQSVKDSTVYVETISFDTVVVDNSELWLNMLFECDSSGSVLIRQIDSLQSKNIDLTTLLKDNRLIIHANVPARVIRVPKLMKSLSTTVVQQRFTNILTHGQSFWIVMGKIFAGSILLTLIVGLLWLRFKR